ncbi:MAG TPA: hypothetical protein PKI20_21445 [Verrucomicrobiota bacterium]|nr:hypothetical protein [Verrucomicrobiota bacterium]HQL80364.1 hypothetical protein [Verrucomicrobiota bacterium]
MTPLQNSLYFREWGRVRATCKQHGFHVPDRHALHVKALGLDKSHLDFTNDDFDRVLAEFRAISSPEDLDGQLRQQDQPRRRLLYSICRLAPEPYWRAIARDKFGTADETRLDLEQLRQLRITLAARSRSKQRQAAAAG